MSLENEVRHIEQERLQKRFELNGQQGAERGAWENNQVAAVQRAMYWDQKRREIDNEAARKTVEVGVRQRALDDAVVIGPGRDGKPVTAKMLREGRT